jgi:hypothetical protein
VPLIDPEPNYWLSAEIGERLPSEPGPRARLIRFGMFVSGDDQLRLSGLSFEALDFQLGFRKDVASGGTASNSSRRARFFCNLLFVPFNLGMVSH